MQENCLQEMNASKLQEALLRFSKQTIERYIVNLPVWALPSCPADEKVMKQIIN